MRNNGGRQEWFQVQRKLNETLDEIAAQATNAEHQLQVSVVGMGDGSDADLPAIYADLLVSAPLTPAKAAGNTTTSPVTPCRTSSAERFG